MSTEDPNIQELELAIAQLVTKLENTELAYKTLEVQYTCLIDDYDELEDEIHGREDALVQEFVEMPLWRRLQWALFPERV